ncbi:apoptosis regulator R1 isoform X2 [Phyllobates terribilis]|uniref:apoptosis regulator R1 isoform X2 n=1 Tax=Phyllobates terribilis TaxID=111132 RepID=UPI003CCB1A6E
MAQSDPRTRPLVEDFVRYKLCQRSLVPEPNQPASCPLHTAMRAAGDEFEERFRQAFSEISAQIHVTPGTAYTHFAEVASGLFQGGVNWGRVVAFFVFGAALCAESVNKEMAPLLPRIQDWMVTYIETNLRDWMLSNGGWNGFLALYGDGAIEEARRQREGNWASLKTVLTGAVALGALMTVGALFASK